MDLLDLVVGATVAVNSFVIYRVLSVVRRLQKVIADGLVGPMGVQGVPGPMGINGPCVHKCNCISVPCTEGPVGTVD